MDNICARIGNHPLTVLGAERFALLLINSIQQEKLNGTPMTSEEIEKCLNEAADLLRAHYNAIKGNQ